VAGGLGQIGLTTGEVTSLFNVGRSGLEGLASIKDNLLFMDYSTGGALLNTFSNSANNTGITGYGGGFATETYNTGAVEFYNGAGVLAGGFSTFIDGASGLALFCAGLAVVARRKKLSKNFSVMLSVLAVHKRCAVSDLQVATYGFYFDSACVKFSH